tara:strand:+ start:1783 stop:1923 length:141 start_codon:yes stop_codon:yes gene_type:complete
MTTIKTFGSRWRTQAPGSSFNDDTIPLGSVAQIRPQRGFMSKVKIG